MLKYIQSLGAEIYAETQRIVPIRSGALKDSGSLSYTSDGVSIKYSAPYASSLVNSETVDPEYRYVVKAHQRRLPWTASNYRQKSKTKQETFVKEHTKKMGKRIDSRRDTNFLLTAVKNVTKNKKVLQKLVGLDPSITIE